MGKVQCLKLGISWISQVSSIAPSSHKRKQKCGLRQSFAKNWILTKSFKEPSKKKILQILEQSENPMSRNVFVFYVLMALFLVFAFSERQLSVRAFHFLPTFYEPA